MEPGEWVCRNAFHFFSKEKLETLTYPVSVGLHPWHIDENPQKLFEKIENSASSKKVIAIGETGLDRLINVPFDLQKVVFEFHFSLAQKLNKPLIIHCVKAYYDFIPFVRKTKVPMLFHGFNGNEDVLKKLSESPLAFFSQGKALFRQKGAVIWKLIPDGQKLLETDNSPVLISSLYRKAADLEGISLEDLSLNLKKNAFTFFRFEEGR